MKFILVSNAIPESAKDADAIVVAVLLLNGKSHVGNNTIEASHHGIDRNTFRHRTPLVAAIAWNKERHL